jgi:hypothetical protein
MKKNVNFEDVTLRLNVTSRGGGIEIDLTPFGFKGEKMAAYQNYLGGGMLGRVNANNTVDAYNKKVTDTQRKKLDMLEENLMKYFHSLTNPDDDEWESVSFEQNQTLRTSGY